jgi:hypothetical protein
MRQRENRRNGKGEETGKPRAHSAVDRGKMRIRPQKRLLGAGNPIAVSILRRFWQHRPTAEIGRLLLQLAADRQGNLTGVSVLPNSAYMEPCQN